ncbi:MAG: hypothetical protein AAGA08_02905 [Pseudomonadota bacterium]
MAQLRINLPNPHKGQITFTDVCAGHVTVCLELSEHDRELGDVAFPSMPDLVFNAAPDNDMLSFSTADQRLRLTALLGQKLTLTLRTASGPDCSIHMVLPDRLDEPSAPPELDPLLTAMMEDDDIILIPEEEAFLQIDQAPMEPPLSLPKQFADDVAKTLSGLKSGEDTDSFFFLDKASLR